MIKRYANRKLYDTQASRYVTLDQIADLVRAGEDVRVIDNTSKEDLTSVTLAQIIFEEEKKQKSFLPLQAMRNIIQTGGESIHGWVENLKEGVARAEQRVERIFRRPPNDDSAEPAEGADSVAPEEPPSEEASAADEHRAGPAHLVREFLDSSQKAFEDWQKAIDDQIRQVVQTLSPFSGLQREVGQLNERIGQLERQIHALAETEHEHGGSPSAQASAAAGAPVAGAPATDSRATPTSSSQSS
jgi:polyhydroxyalkanoate synthesis repressor PhaR